MGLYLGGKFGEDRWKFAICRAFNSFCVTDSRTHSLTDTQADFIICPMLLMHWADNYRNELCKSYDIDTNETFIVTWLNDKTLNIVTTFVQSVHPSPAYKHDDGHTTHQLYCQ